LRPGLKGDRTSLGHGFSTTVAAGVEEKRADRCAVDEEEAERPSGSAEGRTRIPERNSPSSLQAYTSSSEWPPVMFPLLRFAGHTSVSFTLDRYGHLYEEADERLRDRLAAMYEAAAAPAEAAILALS
jgi:hypothetical protein